MNTNIETNQIHGSKDGCTGAAYDLADNGVDFFNTHTFFDHDPAGIRQIINTDAITDEVRNVLTYDNTLPENFFAEFYHEICDSLVRFHTGNDFHELHVTGGIEEMSSQETFFQIFTEFGRNVFNGKTGCIRGDNTGWFDNLLHLGEKFLFDFQIFDNNFANPVAIRQHAQIVFKVTDGHH